MPCLCFALRYLALPLLCREEPLRGKATLCLRYVKRRLERPCLCCASLGLAMLSYALPCLYNAKPCSAFALPCAAWPCVAVPLLGLARLCPAFALLCADLQCSVMPCRAFALQRGALARQSYTMPSLRKAPPRTAMPLLRQAFRCHAFALLHVSQLRPAFA